MRKKYQDHISYFHSMHTLVSDGFTIINFSISSGLSVKNLLIVIIFQTLTAFENNELNVNRQVISNRFYSLAMKLSSAL